MSLPPSYDLLKLHPNMYYIETGTWLGDSLHLAFYAKSFDMIYGIESNPEKADHCRRRFDGWKSITVLQGDSPVTLAKLLREKIPWPATIFLDAHDSLIEGEPSYRNPFPLLDELLEISKHHIKTHTIIIDDILHLTHPRVTGWTRYHIEELLNKINPRYNIQYIANPVKENMLVATP